MEEGMLMKNWKRWIAVSKSMLILRGILFLLLGGLMFRQPAQTLTVMTIAVGALILLEAIAQFLTGLFNTSGKLKVFVLLNAILLGLLGLFTVTSPLWMELLWIMMIGIWQLFVGIELLVSRDQEGKCRIGTILSGILSVLIGLAFLGSPLTSILAMGWVLAVLFFLSGLSMLVTGLTLK